MRSILILGWLLAGAICNASTYTVTQLTFTDCIVVGCEIMPPDSDGPRLAVGDTEIFTAWASSGTTVVDGVSKSGASYGTLNDVQIYYRTDNLNGAYCGSA